MQSSATVAGTIIPPRHNYAYEHPSTAMQSLASYSRTNTGYGGLGGHEPNMAPSWSSYASIAPSPLPVSAPQLATNIPNPNRYPSYHGATYNMSSRPENIPASYDAVNVQLPPIRPAYAGHPVEPSALQQKQTRLSSAWIWWFSTDYQRHQPTTRCQKTTHGHPRHT